MPANPVGHNVEYLSRSVQYRLVNAGGVTWIDRRKNGTGWGRVQYLTARMAELIRAGRVDEAFDHITNQPSMRNN